MHAQETGPSHTLHSAATGDENERFLEETLNQNEILVNEWNQERILNYLYMYMLKYVSSSKDFVLINVLSL